MSKGQSLQDPYLNILRKERIPVSIFLVNGIKLQGQVDSFDQFVILLRNTVSQMVYKRYFHGGAFMHAFVGTRPFSILLNSNTAG